MRGRRKTGSTAYSRVTTHDDEDEVAEEEEDDLRVVEEESVDKKTEEKKEEKDIEMGSKKTVNDGEMISVFFFTNWPK